MTKPEATDRLLSPAALAEYLQLPVSTVYAWRYRGEGPRGFRVGKHVRYRQSDVDAFLAAQQEAEATRA